MDEYQTTHEWDSKVSLSYTIIDALATVRETNPTDLEPLHTAVDTEALDQLFEPLRDSNHSNGAERVEFTFDGYLVTATASGDVTVQRQSTSLTDGGVTDEDAFQAALAELVQEAEANGVDVEGGWRGRDRIDDSGLGIEIYEVVRRMSF